MDEKKANQAKWEKFKSVIKVSTFLEVYCGMKSNSYQRKKAMMVDSQGQPIDFSAEEYKKINEGIKALKKDLRELGPRI